MIHRLCLVSALLTGVWWLADSAGSSMFYDQSERLALEALPGIASRALSQRGKTFKIAEPVTYYRQEDVALFNVEILVSGVSEPNLVFTGDAERFNAFVSELDFIANNQGHTHFKQTAAGIWEGGKSLVEGVCSIVRHPVDTAKSLGSAVAGLAKYSKKVALGQEDALADAHNLVDALYINEATSIAAENGFSYQEVVTEEARSITEKMTNWKLLSRGATEVALLLVPVAEAKNVSTAAKIGEAAKGVSCLQKTGELASLTRAYQTLLGAASVFSQGPRILRSLQRVSKLAQAESHLASRVIRPLCDPAKLATLGTYAANPRVHKLLYHLHELEVSGGNVARTVGLAIPQEVSAAVGYSPSLVKEQILATYQKAKEMGVFNNTSNLQKMRHGLSPTIAAGRGAGTLVHVDHIIPLKYAPELGNNFANLRYSTMAENTSRGAALDSDAINLAERLQSTGWKLSGGLN